MIFGLKKANWTFQRAMYVLLTKFKWQLAPVNLEDTIIFSRTPDVDIHHVRKVLMLLYDAGVTLSLGKCECFTNHIYYPNQVIRTGLLPVLTRTINAIRRLEHPTALMVLTSFLELCKVFSSARSESRPCFFSAESKAPLRSATDLWRYYHRKNYRLRDVKADVSGTPVLVHPHSLGN